MGGAQEATKIGADAPPVDSLCQGHPHYPIDSGLHRYTRRLPRPLLATAYAVRCTIPAAWRDSRARQESIVCTVRAVLTKRSESAILKELAKPAVQGGGEWTQSSERMRRSGS